MTEHDAHCTVRVKMCISKDYRQVFIRTNGGARTTLCRRSGASNTGINKYHYAILALILMDLFPRSDAKLIVACAVTFLKPGKEDYTYFLKALLDDYVHRKTLQVVRAHPLRSYDFCETHFVYAFLLNIYRVLN